MQDARATEAVDHLQAAALELIEAARAFLDVLEELVADRDRLGEAADAVGGAAEAAMRLAGFGVSTDAAGPAPATPPSTRRPAEPMPAVPVERIPVS